MPRSNRALSHSFDALPSSGFRFSSVVICDSDTSPNQTPSVCVLLYEKRLGPPTFIFKKEQKIALYQMSTRTATSALASAAATAAATASSYLSFRSLTFLGTSSGTPTTSRNVSSYALTLSDGAVWLFDAGEGTQHQLLKCQNVSRGSIDKIFVTHLHGDHSFGLPGLMCSTSLTWTTTAAAPASTSTEGTQQQQQQENVSDEDEENDGPRAFYPHFSRRSQYLEVIGPVGLAAYLRSALISSESRFPFQYRVTELLPPQTEARRNAVQGVLFPSRANAMLSELLQAMRHPDEAEPLMISPINDRDDSFPYLHYHLSFPNTPQLKVQAAALNHRTFCVGYAITEQDAPGTLLMEKVTALGVPKGPMLSKLKSGAAVTFDKVNAEDGSVTSVTVTPEQVVGPSAPGRRVVLLGDTCDSPHMASLLAMSSSGCGTTTLSAVDWVVHESTFNMDKQDLAIPRGHSTTRMAGAFAAHIGAKNLILTHFSARYPSSEKDPEAMEGLRAEAQAAAGNATVVHVADDFKVFDLERKKVVAPKPVTKS
jgi:ribonuclease Z